MLKVLLVDDEPFILQGIKVIIDWEKEGFEIAATAENGLEALEYLKKEKVDLIIADIRMPGMTGLELLEQIRREEISDAYFVILSGYAEFDYARRAMQNKCTEYLLKPVDRETLLKLLHKVRALSDRERQESKAHEEMEHAYFSRHLISLIHGKYDDVNLNYVKKHMKDTQGIRYVEIQKEQPNNLEEQSDKDLRNFQRELYDCCREFLKEDAKHCVFDVSADEHCTEDLSLDQVAKTAGFSKYHFTRLFKQFTNTTYYKYLNRKRIDHAMLLLSDPDIPVTEAALQSGFSSLSTFLRVFRSVKQCTPTEFRDMYIHPEKQQKNP